MRPRVHVEKHVIQHSLFAVGSGALVALQPIQCVATPTGLTQVREGATVSAIYVEMWITSDDATAGTAILTLEKLIGSSTVMTAGESASLGSYDNKKNVLHTFMGLIPPNTQYPTGAIKGWIKIPKGKQRFSLGDRIELNLHGQSNGISACGFFIYKEQY